MDRNMLLAEHLKKLSVNKQMTHRCLAAVLTIDTAACCKIEKGEWKAKKEHLRTLSDMLCVEADDLLALWLAEKVSDIIPPEEVATEVLSIVGNGLKQLK